MTRLRVLMVSDVYFPRVNGVSTSIEAFAKALPGLGVDVTVVAPRYGRKPDQPEIVRIYGRPVPRDPEDRLLDWREMHRHTTAAAAGCDLVHIQTPFVTHSAGMAAANAHRLPVLLTYQTLFEESLHHYAPMLPLRETAESHPYDRSAAQHRYRNDRTQGSPPPTMLQRPCSPTSRTSRMNSLAPHRPTILIVDDTPENLVILGDLLRPGYRVLAAKSGDRALELVRAESGIDLVLLDVMMPGMNGFDVLHHMRRDMRTRDIPVIFITALDNQEDQLRGFALGAVDYITKPILPTVVEARVRAHVELKLARNRLQGENAWLEAEVQRRMSENERTQTVSIRALAHLAETRDPETGNHILRTQGYVRRLAEILRDRPRFRAQLDARYIELLTKSAPLHDIGKVGIPDSILLKPGQLSGDEWAIMKTHAEIGSAAIERAEADVAEPVPFLTLAKEIAHWHHERWDGSGYPDGLAGDAIPTSARLMALADVFDALISTRVYKPAMSFAEARTIIADGRGTHFDPDVVDAFLADFQAFADIAVRYGDGSGET